FRALAEIPPLPSADIPFSSRATPAAMAMRGAATLLDALEADSSARAENWPAGGTGHWLALHYAAKALLIDVAHRVPYAWTKDTIPDNASLCRSSPMQCDRLISVLANVDGIVVRVDSLRNRLAVFAAAKETDAR